MSDTIGERPRVWVSELLAAVIARRSSCRRRGTRMAQVRSRKCRLISPMTVGIAYPAKSVPNSGSNLSTALIRPTVAVCSRSSAGSPRPA
jgi:hypothetical protein